ncbi:MAG: hypothetical protein ABIX01_04145 [Chitinophagaceae bacterium]
MKKNHLLSRLSASVSLLILSLYSFAQDKKLDVEITTKKTTWYAEPWVWIVAGALFILLLVALLRNNKSSS